MTGSFHWAMEQCDNGYWTHVLETVALLSAYWWLVRCGLEAEEATEEPEETELAFQDSYAAHIGDLIVSLVGSRARWGSDYMYGFPKRAILFCNEDVEKRKAALLQFDTQLDVFAGHVDSEQIEVRELCEHSHLLLTPCLQLVAMLSLEQER